MPSAASLSRPLHVGLTGNVASGKSTVAAMLAERGATVIDADQLARDAVATGTPGLAAVVSEFGDTVLAPDGSLDRAALRKRVFTDAEARAALNAIVHPIVGRLRYEMLEEARRRGDRIVVSDIPLLFEVGMEHQFDGVILVDADAELRKHRMIESRKLTAEEAQQIIDAQMPSADKRSRSTWILDNSGSLPALSAQVDRLWEELVSLSARQREREAGITF